MASNKIKVKGIDFNLIKEAAEYFGVHTGNAQRRHKTGWTIEQALELSPVKNKSQC